MAQDHLVRFGLFEADLRAGELRRSGLRIHLQEQPFNVLQMLLEHPGEIVTREEIRQAVWPDNQFGDFDHAINVAVKKLRDALGDDADNPRFVETMARRGYRFIAPVHCNHSSEAVSVRVAVTEPRVIDYRWWIAAATGALLTIAAAILLWWRSPGSQPYQPVPFTTMQGVVGQVQFSPDGNEIAFPYGNPNLNTGRVYIQALGSIVARPFIDDPEPSRVEAMPRWLRDGQLAYKRRLLDGQPEIWIVPRTGGRPRKLIAPEGLMDFDVAPDGSNIAITQATPNDAPSVYLVSLKDSNRLRLTWPPEDKPWGKNAGVRAGDRMPRYSPDGHSIAFIRLRENRADLMLVPVTGGEPKRLNGDSISLAAATTFRDFAWTPDGKSLVALASQTGGAAGLWRVRISDKNWKLLMTTLAPIVAVSHQGRLALVESSSIQNIWQFDLPRAKTISGEPLNLTNSLFSSLQPKLSPDGSRLVFNSNRTGHFEIYVAGSDGTNPLQLTMFSGNDAGSPRWSPDGKRIVFDFRPDKRAQIFAIDASGGPPMQMTFGDQDNVVPRYSQNGRWIYFCQLRKGGSDVWKVPPTGGLPILVKSDAWLPEESIDGKTLYYTKLTDKRMAIYARRIEGGDERLLFEDIEDTIGGDNHFVVTEAGIYYRRMLARIAGHQLMFYDFAKNRSEMVLKVPFLPIAQFSISPDQSRLVAVKGQAQTNIMMVENFR